MGTLKTALKAPQQMPTNRAVRGRCRAVLCRAVPCRDVPCRAVPSCAVLCCAVLCCAVLCCAVLCCAVLCCAVLCPIKEIMAFMRKCTFVVFVQRPGSRHLF